MTNCYSDAYGLDELDEGPAPVLRPPSSKAAAAAPRPLPPEESPQPQPEEQQLDGGASEAGPPPAPSRLLYVHSPLLCTLSRQLPVNSDRPALVHALAAAAGLLAAADIAEPRPASIEELREYHSLDYLAALRHFAKLSEQQRGGFGLQDDCAPFPRVCEYAALVAGGSLHAAGEVAAGRCRTAVHLEGGRHHAHKSRAAGFCYVNDVVLAILRLLSRFRRVLYVDVDIHHCDAVQEAFNLTDRVLTVSLHKYAPGFFPGTGSMHSVGEGRGRGFSLNLPLEDGLRDDLFAEAFHQLVGGAMQLFQPDCVVLQCGVDGLAHDPVAGSWALSPRGYAAVAAEAAGWGLPLLVLGGGGYDDAAAARAWAAVLAALLGEELADDVPDHEYLDRYGPNYQIYTASKPVLKPDTNSPESVGALCRQLLGVLRGVLGGGGAAGGKGAGPAKRARAA